MSRDPLVSLIDAGALEIGRLLARLADKLGAARVELHGCEQPEVVRPLAPKLRHSAAAGDVIAAIDAALLLERGPADLLAPLARRARAVVVFPATGEWSADSQAAMRAACEAAGLSLHHVGFVARADLSRRDRPLVIAGQPGDGLLAELVACGSQSLRLDPDADFAATSDRPSRVCIASYEAIGPTRTGGIGTTYSSLAQALAEAGHDVTLLFTGLLTPDDETHLDRWREYFAAHGVGFDVLGLDEPPVRNPFTWSARAWQFDAWLRRQAPFDVVHTPETHAAGYFALAAKRFEGRYANTTFVVRVASPSRWIAEASREPTGDPQLLQRDHAERRCVALADVVVCPSAYMRDYLLDRGWTIPQRCFVQQHVLPRSVRELARRNGGAPSASDGDVPDELIFFGRLETRKGLELFCDALDLLATAGAGPKPGRVLFLGRESTVDGEPATELIARRRRRWPWDVEVRTDLDQVAATRFIAGRRCVVVAPSLVDNLPNAVSEAVALGVPVVASASGGTAEILHPDDLAAATFEAHDPAFGLPPAPAEADWVESGPEPLAALLRARLASDEVASSRLAVPPDRNERDWVEWHAAVVAASTPTDAMTSTGVEIVRDAARAALVVHPGRRLGALLGASEHLRAAVAEGLEVVVVAQTADVAWEAQRLAREQDTQVAVLRSDAPRGAGLQTAADACNASILLFSDGFVVPAPGEARTACQAAALRVVAFAARDMGGDALVPAPLPPVVTLAMPALHVGAIGLTRAALDGAGGLRSFDDAGDAESDLLVRLALEGDGYDVVPALLMQLTGEGDAAARLRRVATGEATFTEEGPESRLRALTPFMCNSTPQLRDLPALFDAVARGGSRTATAGAAQVPARALVVDAEELETLRRWGEGHAEWAQNLARWAGDLERERDALRAALDGAQTANAALLDRLLAVNRKSPT